MHNNYGEIFSGSCRKPVQISELVWTTLIFQFFRDQAESKQGHEGGGVAETGQKEEEKW